VSTTRGQITRVRFAGLRTAASVELDLGGLTVLIGPNGVGKSSLIEGLELLRRVMTSDDFVGALHEITVAQPRSSPTERASSNSGSTSRPRMDRSRME
jgi:predicted ATP-dependent endonuclease of OLD family